MCLYKEGYWNFVWHCLTLPVIGPAKQVPFKGWQKLPEYVISPLLQYFTNFIHGFFGLRDDYSRNESTEFVMGLLLFAEARFQFAENYVQ